MYIYIYIYLCMAQVVGDLQDSDLMCLKWVVVKSMGPFLIPIIIRHPIFRVPKKEP